MEKKHPIPEEIKTRIKILLADDDFINQKVIAGILRRLGYNVDIFSNGKDAVKALEQTSYDLVLMDCQMPEMDGFKATEEIRNPDSKVINHKVPVIALTGDATEGEIIKFKNAGMNDFLSKPVKPPELSTVIEKWLFAHEPLQEEPSPDQITGEGEVLDQSILKNTFLDDTEMMSKILNDYLEYIPDKITGLKKAFDNGDTSSVRNQAHTLKGSSGNIGATAIQNIFDQIKVAGEIGNLSGVDSLLLELDEQIVKLKKAISELEI